MKAVMANCARPEMPDLNKWLHHAHSAAFRLAHEGALNATLKPHDQLSQLNVLVQLEHLMSYVIVRERVLARTLRLHGWFDVASGSMYTYDRTCRSFEVIDRQMAERDWAQLVDLQHQKWMRLPRNNVTSAGLARKKKGLSSARAALIRQKQQPKIAVPLQSGLLKTSTQSDAQEAKQMRSAAYMACASASSASFNAFKPLGSPVPITACYYQRIIDL